MKEVMLIKSGELSLKGQNRRYFEKVLISNIRKKIAHLGDFIVQKGQLTIHVEPINELSAQDYDELFSDLHKVFGIASISRCKLAKKDMDDIFKISQEFLHDELTNAKTFKVESRRSDKKFPLISPEISRKVGGHLLRSFENLKVDVHNPEITVHVEIRENGAYIHSGGKPGAGGLPVATSGKATVMMSGGIDSPVASYMMAKRGLSLIPVHFESPPYTSKRARLKVVNLCKKIAEYTGDMYLNVVPFTKIQMAIKNHCHEDYATVIMRRFMTKITQMIAKRKKASAIINGESLGQVASQTIEAIAATDISVTMPILRPLIGMDKSEIIKIAKTIGTYETSILPYDDCCTVFSPKRPKTKPKLNKIEIEEAKFDFEPLLKEAFENTETILIKEEY